MDRLSSEVIDEWSDVYPARWGLFIEEYIQDGTYYWNIEHDRREKASEEQEKEQKEEKKIKLFGW